MTPVRLDLIDHLAVPTHVHPGTVASLQGATHAETPGNLTCLERPDIADERALLPKRL